MDFCQATMYYMKETIWYPLQLSFKGVTGEVTSYLIECWNFFFSDAPILVKYFKKQIVKAVQSLPWYSPGFLAPLPVSLCIWQQLWVALAAPFNMLAAFISLWLCTSASLYFKYIFPPLSLFCEACSFLAPLFHTRRIGSLSSLLLPWCTALST